MKVYILVYIDWELNEPLGVYSSKALAIKAREKAGFDEYECRIFQKQLDKVYPR